MLLRSFVKSDISVDYCISRVSRQSLLQSLDVKMEIAVVSVITMEMCKCKVRLVPL